MGFFEANQNEYRLTNEHVYLEQRISNFVL